MQYDPQDIVGITLYAKKPVPIVRLPYDSEQPAKTIPAGQPVGEVYSFLLANEGRTGLYWMFYDQNNRPYYARHEKGLFDENSIQNQGVLSTEQKNQPAWLRQARPVLIWTGVAIVASKVLPAIIRKL